MRIYVLAVLAAALFVPPTSAFSQVDVEVGPGGVYVGPRHRHYDHGYHQGDRYGGARCRELRQACLHKEELGERGWATAADIANFADSKRQPPLRAWRSRTPLSPALGSPRSPTPACIGPLPRPTSSRLEPPLFCFVLR